MSGTNDPAPIPIPIIVGVTGHRDIDPAHMTPVRNAVHDILSELKGKFGAALHVMTALAPGADQLVAEVANCDDLKIKIIVVYPMPEDTYRCRFSGRERTDFDRLKKHPDVVLTLTLPHVKDAGNTSLPTYDPLHYQQLGTFIARRSHLLLALWEGPGSPAWVTEAAPPGGTADTIRLRIDPLHAAEAERRSELFDRKGSPLDTPRSDAIVYVAAGRLGRPMPNGVRPGNCFVLNVDPSNTYGPWKFTWRSIDPPNSVLAEMGKKVNEDFDHIEKLNSHLQNMSDVDRIVFKGQLADLRTPGVDRANEYLLPILKIWQSSVDTSAMRYQRNMIGAYSARTVPELIKRMWRSLIGEGPKPGLNVLTVYGLLLPLSVVLFESYSKLDMGPAGLAAYIGVALAASGFYVLRIDKGHWQDQWQDYRALAEALRVQLYWSVAALPLSAADKYMLKQDEEVGWVRTALQGPAIWSTAQALQMPAPARDAAMTGWIRHQAEYFVGKDGVSGKAKDNSNAKKRNKYVAITCYAIGVAIAGLVLAAEMFGKSVAPSSSCLLNLLSSIETNPDVHHWLEVIAVTMPAIAAYLTLSSNQRAYEAHTRSYQQMGAILRRAIRVERELAAGPHPADDPLGTKAFKNLVREVGEESLAETAEWLMDHRDRRVEPAA